jgi:hypothetical protein
VVARRRLEWRSGGTGGFPIMADYVFTLRNVR